MNTLIKSHDSLKNPTKIPLNPMKKISHMEVSWVMGVPVIIPKFNRSFPLFPHCKPSSYWGYNYPISGKPQMASPASSARCQRLAASAFQVRRVGRTPRSPREARRSKAPGQESEPLRWLFQTLESMIWGVPKKKYIYIYEYIWI